MRKTTAASRAQFDGKLLAYATATAATLGGASSLDASVTNITTADFGGYLPTLSSSSDNVSFNSPFNAAGCSFILTLNRAKSTTQTLGTHIPGMYFPGAYHPATVSMPAFNDPGTATPGFDLPGVTNTFKNAALRIVGSTDGAAVAANDGSLRNLALNQSIGVSFGGNGFAFKTNSGSASGSFIPESNSGFVTGYAGFKAGSNYGWLRIKVGRGGDGRPQSIELLADGDGIVGAFGDNTILAGQVAAIPEPATVGIGLGLLALGAVGVREHRRRKAA